MTFSEFSFLVRSDLFRYNGRYNLRAFIAEYFHNPGFTYSFWMRTAHYFWKQSKIYFPFFAVCRFILGHYQYKYGIAIPYKTSIASGFYIGHFGGIVISAHAVIGKNCNISQGVTIGVSSRGKRKGYPVIGDNVYIGPGAKIFGSIKIADHVAIGANSVVTKDIHENAVSVGIPSQVISDNGSHGYINNIDYP